MATIFVRVGRTPGVLEEVCMDDESPTPTVSQALSLAELTLGSNDSVQVNGRPALTSSSVADGDRVTITTNIKGN